MPEKVAAQIILAAIAIAVAIAFATPPMFWLLGKWARYWAI